MSQEYSDPKRKDDPYALPDVEVWEDRIAKIICQSCGTFDAPYDTAYAEPHAYCPSCGKEANRSYTEERFGWFYWSCFPGCLPDGDPIGPFISKESALADAQANADELYDNERPPIDSDDE